MSMFLLGEDHLTVSKALEICQGKVSVSISQPCIERIKESQASVLSIVEEGKIVYGINTGFGPLCTTQISKEDTAKLQVNLLKSHSTGVGESIPMEIAKLMLLLKVHALCQGYSGISLTVIERILWHFSHDAIPLVPSKGSLGASGDLAPLSHLFLPLIGEGRVQYQGKTIDTKSLFQKTGIEAISLGPKEGLALINGTQFIAAYSVMVVHKMKNCLDHADIIGAMMNDAIQGSHKPYNLELHELRPHTGNQYVSERLSLLLQGSEINESHENCKRVQDPYSIRCIPQVHGASRSAWMHLKEAVEVELNSVTDNPVIFDKDHTISGGNFHGQPLALPLDYVCLASAELGNISDRRIYLSLDKNMSGLPNLLIKDSGLNSGFMILQYTTAALVSENKTLCFPASADSIPSSLGQEDHVSMGSISARKAYAVLENLEHILAIEMICASQALEMRHPVKSSLIIEKIFDTIRKQIPFTEFDRIVSDDITLARDIIINGDLEKLLPNETFSQTDLYGLYGIY